MKRKRKVFDYKQFKKRLKKIGGTQREVAEMVGVDYPHMSRLLSGQVKRPLLENEMWQALKIIERQSR